MANSLVITKGNGGWGGPLAIPVDKNRRSFTSPPVRIVIGTHG